MPLSVFAPAPTKEPPFPGGDGGQVDCERESTSRAQVIVAKTAVGFKKCEGRRDRGAVRRPGDDPAVCNPDEPPSPSWPDVATGSTAHETARL
jgi:hypothetical protein